MSRMSGFIFHDRYLKRLENLSDQEVGRLVRALVIYHAQGETQELKGREQGAYDFIRADIDEAEAAHEDKCQTNRKNGGKRTQTNGSERKRTQANAYGGSPPQKIAIDGGQNSIAVVVGKESNDSGEENPFGITDEEIQVSLEMEGQIEELARYVGLETTLAALDKAKELARKYGLENLLAAMREAVDVHTWRYVRGILEKGGVQKKDQHAPGTIYRDGKAYYVDENGDEVRWLDA